VAREKEIPKVLEKALVIEDKNGDQWVLQPGKAPEKVPGGGLPAGLQQPLSRQAEDLIRVALSELKSQAEQDLAGNEEKIRLALEQVNNQAVKVGVATDDNTDDLPSFSSVNVNTNQNNSFWQQTNLYYQESVAQHTNTILVSLNNTARKDFAKILGRKSIAAKQTLGRAIDTRLGQKESPEQVRAWVKTVIVQWVYEIVFSIQHNEE
jgi:hypothetical protein